MLLITVSEWLGPNRNVMDNPDEFGEPIEPIISLQGYVTKLPMNYALERLEVYRRAYDSWSKCLALCFTVVYINRIEEISPTNIENMSLLSIEDLPSLPEDFNK